MRDNDYRMFWFNDYTEVKFQDGTVLIGRAGTVEITVTGGYYGDDVEACFSFEELEKVFAMAGAMRSYFAAQETE